MPKDKSLVGSFTWSFFDKFFSQLVSVVVSIILARLILPEQYGIIAVATIFISIGEVFATYGFGTSLVQSSNVNENDINAVFTLNLLVDVIIYSVFFFVAPLIASFYSISNLSLVIRILSLRIPIAGFISIQKACEQRIMNFKVQFRATLWGSIISGILGISLAYLGLGVWALVTQYLVNAFVISLFLLFQGSHTYRLLFDMPRIVPFFRYGWKILAVSVITKIYDEIRSFIIGKKYTPSDLAFYNRGTQYPVLAVSIFNSAISSVVFPLFSRAQDDKTEIKNRLKYASRLSCFVLLPLMTSLLIISEPLIEVLLTNTWKAAVPYFRLSCISCMVIPLQECNILAIRAIGRSDIGLKNELPSKLIGILTIVLAIVMFDTPIALAASFIVYSVSTLLINMRPTSKLLGYGFCEQIRDILPTIIKCIIMIVVSVPISNLVQNPFVLLTLLIVVCVLTYIALSFLFKTPEIKILLDLLKSIRPQ